MATNNDASMIGQISGINLSAKKIQLLGYWLKSSRCFRCIYNCIIPYKQKIWLEKYLAKSITNHLDEIKFGGSRVTLYNKNTTEFAIGELNLEISTKIANRQI